MSKQQFYDANSHLMAAASKRAKELSDASDIDQLYSDLANTIEAIVLATRDNWAPPRD